jgi:hypothetical protein
MAKRSTEDYAAMSRAVKSGEYTVGGPLEVGTSLQMGRPAPPLLAPLSGCAVQRRLFEHGARLVSLMRLAELASGLPSYAEPSPCPDSRHRPPLP